jgi:hypothetical protein
MGNTARVTSSIVYTPVPQVGKSYPYDEKDEEWMPSGSAKGRVASKLKRIQVLSDQLPGALFLPFADAS